MGKRAKKIKAEVADLDTEYENKDFSESDYLKSMAYIYLNHVPEDRLADLIVFMKKTFKES